MRLIEYENVNPEVRAAYYDFLAVRKTDWINNFWKAIAHHPPILRRTWERIKEVMAPGALDLVTKQMIYVAVSATNHCAYGVATHIAAGRVAGMTDEMFGELMAVVGLANEANRLVSGYQIEIDKQFEGFLRAVPLRDLVGVS